MKYINVLLYPIKKNFYFFVFLYSLGILTSLLETWGLNFRIPRFNFLSWIVDVYILCVILEIIPKKIKMFVQVFILLITYCLSIVDIFCVETFKAKIGPEIVNVILETNPRESSEFVSKYISWENLNTGVVLILILFILHIYTIICRSKVDMLLSYIKNTIIKMRLKTVFKLVLFSLVAFSFFFCIGSRINLIMLIKASDIKEFDYYINNYSENTPFNNLVFSLKVRQLSKQGLVVLKEKQDSVKIDSCSYTSPHIVLIIGESYIKCHSQLYGYQLATTPRQMSRMNQSPSGCLITFADVVSPSNLTSVVFKNVFSLHSIEDEVDWTSYPLFPVIFRRAGYKVAFLTNQYVKDLNTDIFNFSGGLFLNNEKLSSMQFDFRNSKTHQYDLDLLSDYDSLKIMENNYSLTIFHLAGQHIDFFKRCPPKMRRFNVADYEKRAQLTESEKQLVADYDNATYYNDFVVDSIIRKFEKDDVVIIYMPDHGEECFDELHRMGRLPVGDYSPEVLRQEYSIPFWIWCSSQYIINHYEIFNQIRNSCKKPYMIDDLPHLLLYLGGISCKYYNDKRCLISPGFNKKRKRLIEGKVDYDIVERH